MKTGVVGIVVSSIVLGASCGGARADVTVQQNTSLEVASVVHMHGANTTSITADKKREDTETHCEGMMSIVCGNLQSGEIVRLDRDLSWHLEPTKKRYRETVFATPVELAAMRARMQANLEKMRSCPVSQKQQPVDQSKCEMSPPKIEVHKTDDRLSIAGHDTQRTAATLTETCTDKQTGDACDTVIAVDVWLTQDKLPGSADRHAFDTAYAKKLGLEESAAMFRGQAAQYLGPYQAQIKQLTDRSSEFKGQPLKTTLRVMMGGQQCSAATKAKANDAGGNSSSVNPLANVTQTGKAIGNLVGGLFHKNKTDDSGNTTPDGAAAASNGSTATANAAAPAATMPDPYAQYLQMATYNIETVNISTDAVPETRFDVPADWTKETPPPAKSGDSDYTCPKT